jgi:hypothetical protein
MTPYNLTVFINVTEESIAFMFTAVRMSEEADHKLEQVRTS